MEQTKNSGMMIQRRAESARIASYVSFIAFAAYLVFLTFGSIIENGVYVALAVAVALYVLSLTFNSSSLVSIAWLILGISFVTSFLSPGHNANYLTVTLSVLLLIASYELNRFSFVIQPIARKVNDLNEESLNQLQTVMRNHSLTLLQVFSLSLVSSIVVEYISAGMIIVNPPASGVIIFASLAVLVLVSLTLLRDD